MMWDAIVWGIALHLLYSGETASEHCPPQTVGSCYTKELGAVPRETLRNHHQGSEPQMTSSGGTAIAPRRYQSMLPVGSTQEDQAAVYSWRDIGTGGEYGHYARGDAASGGQTDHPLSDTMVTQASACKSTMADPQQIEAWFKETESRLVETTDFLWWPQLFPLTTGQDKIADENARKLACCLVASWQWASTISACTLTPKQDPGINSLSLMSPISTGPAILSVGALEQCLEVVEH